VFFARARCRPASFDDAEAIAGGADRLAGPRQQSLDHRFRFPAHSTSGVGDRPRIPPPARNAGVIVELDDPSASVHPAGRASGGVALAERR